jgi:prophage regulatory protein
VSPHSTPLRSPTPGAALPVAPAPSSTPAQTPVAGFLRQPQVLGLVPISKSTLWRRVQAGTFPLPVKLSERVTVWRAVDVHHWIGEQGGQP